MWFDATAALADIGGRREINAQPPATPATSATPRARVAIVADVATPPKRNHETAVFRHGVSLGGNPMTWTGRIVSLSDWRRLSDWEKHGPDGRHWNGITKQWETPKGIRYDQETD